MALNEAPSRVEGLVETVRGLLGAGGVIDAPAEMERYVVDWRGEVLGDSELVGRPASTAEVAALLQYCHAADVAVIPQGGNTGLAGGAIPVAQRRSIVLSLERMDRIRQVDADDFTMVAEAGAVLQRVQEVAIEHDRHFPLSLGAEGSCTIGGNISTNAGGNMTIRYGNARERVLGLEVVLPDGTVLDNLNRLRKSNTGYDLKQLFIGAEGTLGVITAAALQLVPRPRQRETAFLALTDLEAAQALLNMAREISGDQITVYELLPRLSLDLVLTHIEGTRDPIEGRAAWYILMELTSASALDDLRGKLEAIVERAMADGLVADGVVAESEAQRAGIWRFREELPSAMRLEGGSVSCDISVPVSKVVAFLQATEPAVRAIVPDCRFNTFGHMGDGNIHYVVARPSGATPGALVERAAEIKGAIYELALSYGGSYSAEHGIGSMKRDEFERYEKPERLALMRAIKGVIDPKGLMNPGKVLG
ncbi:MAG: FAD-binding oxidoreductase [Alphaproteobacteria bacterium]|jgi:FAD/FMN-containing dehydrogenase|nr:FAD-binding oxidoreductase [Alphaproteobacteria bacterium]